MSGRTLPEVGPPVRPVDLERAGAWLAGHKLDGAPPTLLLAARLAVRRRTRLAAAVLLAVFLIAVALIYTGGMADGSGFRRWAPAALTATVAALVLAQSLLDWWVRRVDRQVAAGLPRRAAHPVTLGWRTVLGLPRAAFAVVTFAGAAALALGALTLTDPTARYAAVILLIGLCGLAAGVVVQLRHVLTHPVVADDAASLTADLVMRAEDARTGAMPASVWTVWSLPVVSVFSTAFGWWNAAWIAFIVMSVVALALIEKRTAGTAAVAREVMSTP